MVAMMLYKIGIYKCCGLPVAVNCMLTTLSHLRKVVKNREENQASIDIWGLDIATPSVGVASAHSGDSQRFAQLTQQVSDRLEGYVEEQVQHMESIVQVKIPTTPKEDNNIPPPITNTSVGFGLGLAMGVKPLNSASLTGMKPPLNIRVHFNNRTYSEAQIKEAIIQSVKELLWELLGLWVLKLEAKASWRSWRLFTVLWWVQIFCCRTSTD